MNARIVVYTCVFGGYDRVYPPVESEPGIDYVLVTDDQSLHVPGWRTLAVDPARFGSAKAPNRYFKMLAHREILAGYDLSIYVDGNIRVIGSVRELALALPAAGAAMGAYPHPLRNSVAEEAMTCLERGKLDEAAKVESELAFYREEGFPDADGLVETGVLVKDHAHPGLDPAMELWWKLFERFDSRDQLSLPYVRWRLGLPMMVLQRSFREPNPHFGIYPHRRAPGVSDRYVHIAARAFDSPVYAFILRGWHMKWALQRIARRIRSPS